MRIKRKKSNNIYKKKLKIHILAHEIVTTKDELKKRKLRIQLKRQVKALKMMKLPSRQKTILYKNSNYILNNGSWMLFGEEVMK